MADGTPDTATLRCLGELGGPATFLDGRTHDGTVGLAPATDGPFTGTHWRIVNSARMPDIETQITRTKTGADITVVVSGLPPGVEVTTYYYGIPNRTLDLGGSRQQSDAAGKAEIFTRFAFARSDPGDGFSEVIIVALTDQPNLSSVTVVSSTYWVAAPSGRSSGPVRGTSARSAGRAQ